MKTFQPIIKWSGSKRSQAEEIVSHFPKDRIINTYREPFCGGCSVLRHVLDLTEKDEMLVNNFVCSDINVILIELWNMIKDDPKKVYDSYESHWTNLNSLKDISQQKEYYNKVRDNFNAEKDCLDFMFLDRTCFNGLIRFNRYMEFNSPFHVNRTGITPDKFKKILYEWSELLNKHNVIFELDSYLSMIPENGDFIYFDPPYAGTKGMYNFDPFDNKKFFEFLERLNKVCNCYWALSYNGKSGDTDNTFEVPKIYDEHFYIKSGNSSFKRLNKTNKVEMVYESLYVMKSNKQHILWDLE